MKLNTFKIFLIDIIKNPKSLLELKKWYFFYRQQNRSPLDYEIPWMTFSTIEYLSHYLTQDMELFEWGSGGSTLFFSQKVKKIISIEHDKEWYNYEINKLSNLKNLELYLIEPEQNGIYKNKRKGYENLYFDSYVNFIDKYDKFDVIIVDGRQRNECFKKALQHVKKDGIIVFDNFDRNYYYKSLKLIDKNEFEIINCRGFVPFGTMQSLTTIFRKK